MDKPLYILCRNHMDPTWKRCWEEHFVSSGELVRPYADVEDLEIRQWLDIMEETGCRYSLEQTISIKEYLERHPDDRERVAAHIRNGALEMLGGGETVIDYNMVCGESIVRNHLYSIAYAEGEFGVRPSAGVVPDTFGVSAQMPQLFRGLGYSTILQISRVFPGRKAFWRGLDGSVVYIGAYGNVARAHAGSTVPMPVPGCCDGDGCLVCGYTGLDLTDDLCRDMDKVRQALVGLWESDAPVAVMTVGSEEQRVDSNGFLRMIEMAREMGFAVRFVTVREQLEQVDKPWLDRLRDGTVAEEEIDERVEGNPVCTGCYTSRVELKKWNRRLEDLLLSAEKFAVFACDYGMLYPRRTIARLWNDMALLQFHDAITGSHSDPAYDELLRLCRDIQTGAGTIHMEALGAIERQVTVETREGFTPLLAFNPLAWNVASAACEAVLETPDTVTDISAEIVDSEGRLAPVLAVTPVELLGRGRLKVSFLGAELPATGYRTYYARVGDASWRAVAPLAAVSKTASIENEYYRVTIDRRRVTEIFDKELGRVVAGRGANDFILEEDYGSPWETLAQPYCPACVNENSSTTATVMPGPAPYACIAGVVSNKWLARDHYIHRLAWSTTVSLLPGVKRVLFRTEIDWNTENARVLAQFPLLFRTHEDRATYEIPYGALERPAYKPRYGVHTNPNGDWPALNFVGCTNREENYSVVLYNRGLCALRLHDGVLRLALVRSPQLPVYCRDYKGAAEKGKHVFEYMLSSGPGEIGDVRAVRTGLEYNTAFVCVGATVKNGTLPPSHSFLSNENPAVVVAAVKRAEENSDLIVRAYETRGAEALDQITDHEGRSVAASCDLLENDVQKATGGRVAYRGFEVKTLRMRKP